MRLLPLICAATLLATSVLPAQAQWKWKDERGQVHVSDTPPPREVQDKDILQRPKAGQPRVAASAPIAPPASAVASRPGTDPELAARRARQEADAKAKTKADQEKANALKAENCQRARQQLAALDSGQRMARVTPQGERVILDDQMRAEEASQVRRVLDTECR